RTREGLQNRTSCLLAVGRVGNRTLQYPRGSQRDAGTAALVCRQCSRTTPLHRELLDDVPARGSADVAQKTANAMVVRLPPGPLPTNRWCDSRRALQAAEDA